MINLFKSAKINDFGIYSPTCYTKIYSSWQMKMLERTWNTEDSKKIKNKNNICLVFLVMQFTM